jgi:hypothetical protein
LEVARDRREAQSRLSALGKDGEGAERSARPSARPTSHILPGHYALLIHYAIAYIRLSTKNRPRG